MDWLNYHHLLYFYMTAKEGGVTAAAKKLRLAQPTVSGQIRQLENAIDAKLFTRVGRSLVLTDTGRMVYRYADEIFSLGKELMEATQGKPTDRPMRLVVGVADVMPKLLVHRFVAPALSMDEPVQLVCRQDHLDELLGELSVHSIDLVLADSPISPTVSVRAYNHLLGESHLTFFAGKELAKSLKRSFPQSLDGAPFLMPAEHTALRRSLDHWFDANGIKPKVVGEFEDSALLKAFGQEGVGAFAQPAAIEDEVRDQYGVVPLGQIEELKERFYAITVERRIKHPGVAAISEAARQMLH